MANTLSPKSEFAQRIAEVYPSLSKSHQKIADFVLTRPLDVVAMSIEGVAEASGSSTATITRFVRTAGYGGFSEFREKIVSDFQAVPGNKHNSQGNDLGSLGKTSTLHRQLIDSVEKLQDTISNIDQTSSDEFIQSILQAQRIIILGTGASHYAAAYLEEGLALYTEKSVTNALLRGASSYSSNIINSISKNDVVIAISIPRYSQSTLELTKAARAKHAKILVLTDSPTSPLASLADVVLYATATSDFLPNSPSAIFALSEAIVATVAEQRPDIVESLRKISPPNIIR
ncbi:MurR/RpiR family transcriptional regulator [Brucella pseudogrignonensis]|uniref:MurR/RpiR family transcriptional regulator n=1 Tax=Brucella pseudogrignonensis TaxID=419475 RepID=UPI000CFB5DC6|nr:MurR/RpiR family transcriptional regulator [Brucella pseudogrignonensis]MQP41007.1 SIS domain-containing protein [Ochrobactrum sp. MYb237]PQZ40957.1 RpiR family transcriptional regulator [Brucella pseudogrignonensis]PRA40324.1 RpiR family transcriptional regulator [Brucella pseudogrignonensis]PRA68917.1 RpiR family transcriptional regulator [Brucella pseudogrignonensis]